jgi:hypothetical protein
MNIADIYMHIYPIYPIYPYDASRVHIPHGKVYGLDCILNECTRQAGSKGQALMDAGGSIPSASG